MMEDVFKINIDKERAKYLLEMALERLEIVEILPKDKPFRIIEEYYEIILELLTAVMYLKGFKTLSHKVLIEFLKDDFLDDSSFRIVDTLRKHRNDIVYYGKKVKEEFLINNEEEVRKIIDKLKSFVGQEVIV